jgi:hypothetical protein
MANASRLWGEKVVRLYLPMTMVWIDGLSGEQQRAIVRHYESFMADRSRASRKADVVCLAGRLDQPLGFPSGLFTVNGQYAPNKRRSGGEIEITGLDFSGRFVRDGRSPIQATLSVAREEELSRSGVLENFLRILLAHHVLDQGGALLHSAGVLYRNNAYLFSGRSNAGKTTLARKAIAAGADVLSDDINLVAFENGGFRAHKVPFSGELGRRAENLSGCGSFPLGGLVLLEKASRLTAIPVTPAEGVAGLLTGCPYVNDDAREFPALMDFLTRLVFHSPVIRLGVAKEDSFEAIISALLRCYENV